MNQNSRPQSFRNGTNIKYHPQDSQGHLQNTSSFQVYDTAEKRFDPSSFIGSPPPFIIQGHYNYSPINSQMISPPAPGSHLPHFMQNSVPLASRGYNGLPHNFNSPTTIIQAPVPIIKPIVYQTVDNGQTEVIQKMMEEYKILYDQYDEMKGREHKGYQNSKTTQKKTQATEEIFQQMHQDVDSVLNRLFNDRIQQSLEYISKITNEAVREIERITQN